MFTQTSSRLSFFQLFPRRTYDLADKDLTAEEAGTVYERGLPLQLNYLIAMLHRLFTKCYIKYNSDTVRRYPSRCRSILVQFIIM